MIRHLKAGNFETDKESYLKDFFGNAKVGEVFTYSDNYMLDSVLAKAHRHGCEVEYCGPRTTEYREHGCFTCKFTKVKGVEMGNTENIVIDVGAYAHDIIGCKKYERDVMVTFTTLNSSGGRIDLIHDFFLTQEQAIELREQLDKEIEYNRLNNCDACEGRGFLLSDRSPDDLPQLEIQRCDACSRYNNDSDACKAAFEAAIK